jgi:hypothetical protein
MQIPPDFALAGSGADTIVTRRPGDKAAATLGNSLLASGIEEPETEFIAWRCH